MVHGYGVNFYSCKILLDTLKVEKQQNNLKETIYIFLVNSKLH